MVSALANALWQCVKPCPISVARDAYRLCHRTHGGRSQTFLPATSSARQRQPYPGAATRSRRNFHVGQSAHQVEPQAAAARTRVGGQPNSVINDVHCQKAVCYPCLNLDPAVRVAGICVYHRVCARLREYEGEVIGKLLRAASTAFTADEQEHLLSKSPDLRRYRPKPLMQRWCHRHTVCPCPSPPKRRCISRRLDISVA